MQEKQTVIDSKCVGEQNTFLNKNPVNDLYDANFVRSFSLNFCILNDMLVSGLCGIESLPFHPQ